MVPRTIGGAVGKRLPFFVVFAGVAAFAAVETRPPPRQFCFFFFFFDVRNSGAAADGCPVHGKQGGLQNRF